MGPVDFIASLGGLFGLCLGFSIVSFIEIVYRAHQEYVPQKETADVTYMP